VANNYELSIIMNSATTDVRGHWWTWVALFRKLLSWARDSRFRLNRDDSPSDSHQTCAFIDIGELLWTIRVRVFGIQEPCRTMADALLSESQSAFRLVAGRSRATAGRLRQCDLVASL